MSQFAFVVDGQPVAAVTIADADKNRIMAAYSTLPGYDAVPTGEEPAEPGQPAPTRPLTESEMWQAIASGWLQGTLANVQRIEEDEQRRQVTVEPISFEPVQPFEPSAH
jgi:hypothetical protein